MTKLSVARALSARELSDRGGDEGGAGSRENRVRLRAAVV